MNIKEETVYSNVETANSKQLTILKKHFPNCFDRDGNFIQERMLEVVNDSEIELSKESYSLNWLGKSYSRLLANLPPKTLIHADVEHNAQEQHKDSKNLLIKGDNLEVLKHLVNAYSEKVKMIYIDPPYNTGSDGFVYNDDRKFTKEQLADLAGLDIEEAERVLSFADKESSSHSAWLTFMYPRLYVARELLKEDGLIFISIDDNEISNLLTLCDEIFGETNRRGIVSRPTGTPSGQGNDILINELDYVLIYAKTDLATLSGLPFTDSDAKIYDQEDDGGKFLTRTLRKTGGEDRKEDRPTMYYPLKAPNGDLVYPVGPSGYESRWRCGEDTYNQLIEENRIMWKDTKDGWKPFQKFYLEGRTKQPSNLWQGIEGNKKATLTVKNLFNAKVFETPKPVELLTRILNISTNDNDIVLDFFAGSGTTGQAVFEFNQSLDKNVEFILVQLAETCKEKSEALKAGYSTIFDVTKARVEKAAEQMSKANDKSNVDFGFKIFEVIEDFRVEDNNKELTLSNFTMFDDVLLTDEQYQTLLTTWALYDGSELTTPIYDIDLDGYTAHLCDRRLYMIAPDFSSNALKALLYKLDDTDDKDFDPNKIIYYANNFDSVKQMELNEALKSYANKKSIEIDVVVRN